MSAGSEFHIGAVRHMRRHVWQKLWCMQVLVTVVGLTTSVTDYAQQESGVHSGMMEMMS